jgi:hypothetical protein
MKLNNIYKNTSLLFAFKRLERFIWPLSRKILILRQ